MHMIEAGEEQGAAPFGTAENGMSKPKLHILAETLSRSLRLKMIPGIFRLGTHPQLISLLKQTSTRTDYNNALEECIMYRCDIGSQFQIGRAKHVDEEHSKLAKRKQKHVQQVLDLDNSTRQSHTWQSADDPNSEFREQCRSEEELECRSCVGGGIFGTHSCNHCFQ